MARIDLRSRVTVADHVMQQKVDEEMLLLDLDTGTYHGLGPTGTRVWELLSEETSLQRVFTRMLDEYDVSAEQLEHDIVRLVEDLEIEKLVIVAE